MRTATLTRISTGDEGTFGQIVTDTGRKCWTAELPWRKNATGKSCIPAGSYAVNWRYSAKHGNCYHVEDVPKRSEIQIHSANFAGDEALGWQSQLLGCIAPGEEIDFLTNCKKTKQKAVIASRSALAALQADLGQESFQLTVRWEEEIDPE